MILLSLFALKEWIEDNRKVADSITVVEITSIELEKISQLATPNQVLAVAKQFAIDENSEVKSKITLALDNIQDPGNMGTIIRIADWYGIDQIICNNQSADMYNPKVIQSTMGSIARVKVFYTELSSWLAKQNNKSPHPFKMNSSERGWSGGRKRDASPLPAKALLAVKKISAADSPADKERDAPAAES